MHTHKQKSERQMRILTNSLAPHSFTELDAMIHASPHSFTAQKHRKGRQDFARTWRIDQASSHRTKMEDVSSIWPEQAPQSDPRRYGAASQGWPRRVSGRLASQAQEGNR
jgi:hypothetical protein